MLQQYMKYTKLREGWTNRDNDVMVWVPAAMSVGQTKDYNDVMVWVPAAMSVGQTKDYNEHVHV